MTIQAINIGNSVQQSLDSIFAYLPKFLAFLIILIVGYVIAKVVKGVLNKALDRMRVDEKLQQGKAASSSGNSARAADRRI